MVPFETWHIDTFILLIDTDSQIVASTCYCVLALFACHRATAGPCADSCTWTRGRFGLCWISTDRQTDRLCDVTLGHIWNHTTGALHFFITFFYRSVRKIEDPAPARRGVSELQHWTLLKTLRVQKELVADMLQKYGIFIMHEMPAGAQLIRVLEWEQVGMWQKGGRLQSDITLAKQIYKADGSTNTRIINILLMQYRHLSVKLKPFLFLFHLFISPLKRHLGFLLRAIRDLRFCAFGEKKKATVSPERSDTTGAVASS